ncbi:hypothetical protein MKK75_06130 [Methylobacterium sp. J-030]|uniref:hypothetical protein n=1 Tax=Methylobacterium sp. J-030 TaxID=2836627 RepID=UPI001FBA74FA|nr:hypothetical protein [Methylobacterium sp. J-030]MCJ2068391.1 hypothetical protein [Methylobacterium sp. J-030]
MRKILLLTLVAILFPLSSNAAWRGTFSNGVGNAHGRALSSYGTMFVTCSLSNRSYSITIDGYKGKLLDRVDDADQSIALELGSKVFQVRIHYFEPDKSWVLTGQLSPVFGEALQDAPSITIYNKNHMKVQAFETAGIEQAIQSIRGGCRI